MNNKKLEKAWNIVRYYQQKKIVFWCGYALVTVFNKHENVKYWLERNRTDSECIDKKTGKVLFLVDCYFDNGYLSEFNRVWANDFEEAFREVFTFSMLDNLKGVLYE